MCSAVSVRRKRGRSASAVPLPEQSYGLLMVFRVFNKMSYGLVMRANRPVNVNDDCRESLTDRHAPAYPAADALEPPKRRRRLMSPLEAWLRSHSSPGPSVPRKLLARIRLTARCAAKPRLPNSRSVAGNAPRRRARAGADAASRAALSWLQGGEPLCSPSPTRLSGGLLETRRPASRALYACGRVELLDTACVAIVGSRNPTPEAWGMPRRSRRP